MRTTSALLLLLAASKSLAFPPQQILGDQNNLHNPLSDLEAPEITEDVIALHASKPLVDTASLSSSITLEALLSRAKDLYNLAKLSEEDYARPTRVIGSAGHIGTIRYIWHTLSVLSGYYKLSTQQFPAVTGTIYESNLIIGNERCMSANPMSLTPPSKNGNPVLGTVVAALNEGCDESDFENAVNGSIVLIRRGTCSFGQKSTNAGKAGAVAAVIYNNNKGELGGTLGDPNEFQIATFGISGEDGVRYLEWLADGQEFTGVAYIDSVVNKIVTTNVIAQTVLGNQSSCVMLGGHSDSVDAGPGINDDGSGSLTLLELAVQLSKYKVNNCVRFAWWSGEEEGLLGSDYYARTLPDEENIKIRLFMDYDMLASPNYALQIYDAKNEDNPRGSEELRDLFIQLYQSMGVNHTYIPFDGRSDYVGFIYAGIPAGGIATGAEGIKTKKEEEMFGGKAGEWYDHCYHQLCDDLSNLNHEAWMLNAEVVATSVGSYAKTFEGFPERELKKESVSMQSMIERGWKYKGKKLFI